MNTVKILKIWTTKKKKSWNYPKIGAISFYYRVIGPKDADAMANSVDPDQTAQSDLGLHCLEEQSDQGLHCLPRPVCPNN